MTLKCLINELGTNNWQAIARLMPNRNAKQCRDRYNNYLTDNHRTGPWTEIEDRIILMKYMEIGPKWVEISTFIPGRSGNDVKNRWYKHIIRKQMSATSSQITNQEPVQQMKNSLPQSEAVTVVDRVERMRKMYSVANLLVSAD